MVTMGMFEAKTHFSQLVEDLVGGRNDCVRVLRRGKPVVQITLASEKPRGLRIGSMRDELKLPSDFDERFDALDEVVAGMMNRERK